MTYFPSVERWMIPQSAYSSSFAEMARDGARGNEGVALWLGHRENGQADVTHVVALRGSGVVRKPSLLRISDELMNDVTDIAIGLGVSLVGQIHSHGEGYGVDLSVTDRKYGISVPYYLSLVAPDYGTRFSTPLFECGIHVFEPTIGFRRLALDETRRRVVIVQGPAVPVLIAGDDRL